MLDGEHMDDAVPKAVIESFGVVPSGRKIPMDEAGVGVPGLALRGLPPPETRKVVDRAAHQDEGDEGIVSVYEPLDGAKHPFDEVWAERSEPGRLLGFR